MIEQAERPGSAPSSQKKSVAVGHQGGRGLCYISRSSKNSDAGSTLVMSRWSRARVQAT